MGLMTFLFYGWPERGYRQRKAGWPLSGFADGTGNVRFSRLCECGMDAEQWLAAMIIGEEPDGKIRSSHRWHQPRRLRARRDTGNGNWQCA